MDDHLVLSLLDKRMSQSDVLKGYILDGFPRRASQAPLLESLLANLQTTARDKRSDKRAYFEKDNDDKVLRSEWDKLVAEHKAAGSMAFTSAEPDPVYKLFHQLTMSKRKDPVALFQTFGAWVWDLVTRRGKTDRPPVPGSDRTLETARLNHQTMRDASLVIGPTLTPNVVLEVRLKEDVIVKKALGRRVCDTCGDGYNTAHVVERDEHGHELFMPAILPKVEGICDNVRAISMFALLITNIDVNSRMRYWDNVFIFNLLYPNISFVTHVISHIFILYLCCLGPVPGPSDPARRRHARDHPHAPAVVRRGDAAAAAPLPLPAPHSHRARPLWRAGPCDRAHAHGALDCPPGTSTKT